MIGANSAWNVVNFRKPIEALIAAGWRVVALAPDDGNGAAIEELGAEFVPIRIDSSGISRFAMRACFSIICGSCAGCGRGHSSALR